MASELSGKPTGFRGARSVYAATPQGCVAHGALFRLPASPQGGALTRDCALFLPGSFSFPTENCASLQKVFDGRLGLISAAEKLAKNMRGELDNAGQVCPDEVSLHDALLASTSPLSEKELQRLAHPSHVKELVLKLRENLDLRDQQSQTLQSAQAWCSQVFDGHGEQNLVAQMNDIHNLIYRVAKAHFQNEEVEVSAGSNTTDNRVAKGQNGGGGRRGDYVVLANGFNLIRIEYKDASAPKANHEKLVSDAKKTVGSE